MMKRRRRIQQDAATQLGARLGPSDRFRHRVLQRRQPHLQRTDHRGPRRLPRPGPHPTRPRRGAVLARRRRVADGGIGRRHGLPGQLRPPVHHHRRQSRRQRQWRSQGDQRGQVQDQAAAAVVSSTTRADFGADEGGRVLSEAGCRRGSGAGERGRVQFGRVASASEASGARRRRGGTVVAAVVGVDADDEQPEQMQQRPEPGARRFLPLGSQHPPQPAAAAGSPAARPRQPRRCVVAPAQSSDAVDAACHPRRRPGSASETFFHLLECRCQTGQFISKSFACWQAPPDYVKQPVPEGVMKLHLDWGCFVLYRE